MSATDRETLSTAEFTEGLRAIADLIDTDAFDGVKILDERHCPDQGESVGVLVTSEEAVRMFAARHAGAELEEHRDDDGHMIRLTAYLGFGRGTGHDATYGPSPTYKWAATFEVTYLFPEATS